MGYEFEREELIHEGDNEPTDLGSFLRTRRTELGLTQEDVIRKVGPGLSLAYLRRLETGKARNPSATMLLQLATALELPDWTVLGNYVAMTPRKRRSHSKKETNYDVEDKPILQAIDNLYREYKKGRPTAIPWINIAIRGRNRVGLIADITNQVSQFQADHGLGIDIHFFVAMVTVNNPKPIGAQVIFTIDELSSEDQLECLKGTLEKVDGVELVCRFPSYRTPSEPVRLDS